MDRNDRVVGGIEPLFRHSPVISLAEMIFESLCENRGSEALIDVHGKRSVTYEMLLEKSVRLANALQKYEPRNEHVVAILSENNVHYFYPVLACLFSGTVLASLNEHHSKPELLQALNNSRPKIIFCSRNALPKALDLEDGADFVEKIIVMDDDGVEGSHISSAKLSTLDAFLNNHATATSNAAVFRRKSMSSFILYTSGTTGPAKGVLLSQKNLLAKIQHSNDPRITREAESDVVLVVVPFFNVFGLVPSLAAISRGARIITMSKYDPEILLKAVETYKISTLQLTPPLLASLAKSSKLEAHDLTSVKEVQSVTAPLPKNLNALVNARFKGNVLRQTYGSTETTSTVATTALGNLRMGSVGKLVSLVEAKVLDVKTGETLGHWKLGELCFKGDSITSGYHNNPEENERAFDSEGWFRSGDFGYHDNNGYIFVVGRVCELIRHKSSLVVPDEIENFLKSNPKIVDAAVVGVPDAQAGEVPKAFVVKARWADLSAKEVREYVARKSSWEKHLRGGVCFVKAIPRNRSGKILRRKLTEKKKAASKL